MNLRICNKEILRLMWTFNMCLFEKNNKNISACGITVIEKSTDLSKLFKQIETYRYANMTAGGYDPLQKTGVNVVYYILNEELHNKGFKWWPVTSSTYDLVVEKLEDFKNWELV